MIFNLKGRELGEALEKVQSNAGYHFKDKFLMIQALTHPSYATETPESPGDNQRLEFFGDAVLELVLSKYLYAKLPKAQEGLLTRTRSFLANEEATANYAKALGLERVLLLGHGECTNGGRQRKSILGDAFEAFLGAVYLDGSFEDAESVCLKLLPDMSYVSDMLVLEENPKGSLQILCQGHGLGRPEYEKVSITGPVHAPVFEIRAVLGDREIGRGSGTSSKVAERLAAKAAYYRIKKELEGSCFSEVASGNVLALDFDGVLCDSADETAATAWKAARSIWRNDFKDDEMPPKEMVKAFRKVRPFLDTGYQSILMLKMLQENLPFSEFENNLQVHFKRIMDECRMDKQMLIAIFGNVRDSWLREDAEGWLASNRLYPGIADALNTALKTDCKIMILTTKQERFVNSIFYNSGVSFEIGNIWGLERKRKKEELLVELLKQNPATLHFVEDRLDSLLRVEAVPALSNVQLHYAEWGYGTKAHLEVAKQDPRIEVLSRPKFCNWLSKLN